jgi:hypothetical protein
MACKIDFKRVRRPTRFRDLKVQDLRWFFQRGYERLPRADARGVISERDSQVFGWKGTLGEA